MTQEEKDEMTNYIIRAGSPEPRTTLDEFLPGCTVCGKRYAGTPESEAILQWRFHAAMESQNVQFCPSLNAIAKNLICIPCTYKNAARAKIEAFERKIKTIKADILQKGLFNRESFESTFENTNPVYERTHKDAWTWTRARSHDLSCSMWIAGDPGVGKTWMARCILNRAINEGLTVGELKGVHIQNIANKFDIQPDVILYGTVDLLLIDDLGQMLMTDKTMRALMSLIDYRYDNRRATIITSNNSGQDFMRSGIKNGFEIFARPIIDRLYLPNKRVVGLEMRGESKRSGVHYGASEQPKQQELAGVQ